MTVKILPVDWLKEILNSDEIREEKLRAICEALYHNVAYYDWVGFYIADNEKRVLTLGPFVGAPTEHVRIPYGRGICGQAAESLDTIVVTNVAEESNYLACSVDVCSEIVVPVFRDGVFVAELDIDSHKSNPFTVSDKETLESVCRQAATLF